MAIKQVTVFLENCEGSLTAVTEALSEQNLNLRALSIAETEEFGILRLIVQNAASAEKILSEKGYLIKLTDVVGVKIGDEPGKLSGALKVLGASRINVESLYAFLARTEKHAYVVLRVEDTEAAENILANAGYHLITTADVEKL